MSKTVFRQLYFSGAFPHYRAMILLVTAFCLFFLAYALARRGLRYALCLSPGLCAFAILAVWIRNILTPTSYPGDFFDAFLPAVSIPLYLVFVALSAVIAWMLSKWVLQLKGGYFSESPALFSSPRRLAGVIVLTSAGLGCVALSAYLPQLRDEEQRLHKARQAEKMDTTVAIFAAGSLGEADFVKTMERLPRDMLCERSFASEVEMLLAVGNVPKAAVITRTQKARCLNSPTVDDILRYRQRDGHIQGLDKLLALGVGAFPSVLNTMASYSLENHNDNDFYTMLAYFLDERQGEKPTLVSSDALRTLLVMLAYEGADKKELLTRFAAKAGREPLRYLALDDFDATSYALLYAAVNKLEPDMVKFYGDLGFTKENTHYGSLLFSFAHMYGGPALIQRIIDLGAPVNAMSSAGETPLYALVSRPDGNHAPYEREKEQRIVKTFEQLFALSGYGIGVTTDGETLLHVVCREGRYSPQGVAEITVLLKAGADPGLVGPGLLTPLAVVTERGWNQARALLQKGVPPTPPTKQQKSGKGKKGPVEKRDGKKTRR